MRGTIGKPAPQSIQITFDDRHVKGTVAQQVYRHKRTAETTAYDSGMIDLHHGSSISNISHNNACETYLY